MNFMQKKKESSERDLPKVVFGDITLVAKIGLWSEVLFSKYAKKITNTNYYDYLCGSADIKKISIPKELLEEIGKEFGSILKRASVDKDEICTLTNLDEKNFSFNCHLERANKDAKITLRWGDPIDEPAHFTYEDQDISSTYEYFYFRGERPSELTLTSYTINDGEKAFNRKLFSHIAYFIVADDKHNLSITIRKPATNGYSSEKYRLNNEDELQEYLLNVALPVDIDELYKRIRDISLGDISEYPEIHIIAKDITNGEDKITDEIVLVGGDLYVHTNTKNGRTITIDGNGNWTFSNSKVLIEKSNDGKVSYTLNMDSYDELVSNLARNQFVQASEEVQDVKQYTKSIFNK